MNGNKDHDTLYIWFFQVANNDCKYSAIKEGYAPAYINVTANLYTLAKGPGVLSECVTIDSCPSYLDSPTAPSYSVIPCGFDEQKNSVKICCPEDQVTKPQVCIKDKVTIINVWPWWDISL